jgi:hypothetical protein
MFAALPVTAALALLSIAPGVASASPGALWVGKAAASPGGNSCSRPGYNSIQAAVNAAGSGSTITVCAGTYTEQVEITKSLNVLGSGSPTIALPAAPVDSATACDAAVTAGGAQAPQDGVDICGAINVTLQGVTVSAAWPAGTCYDSLYGVLVGGGATLNFFNSAVTAAGAVPLNGCQGGVGIEGGDSEATPLQVAHVNVVNSSVSGYQKNGITVDGKGSTASVSSSTVTGIGPTAEIAQNGIQVSDQASGQVIGSTVTGDECNYPVVCGPNALTQYDSTGVLFYLASAGSSVIGSTISGTDDGIYYTPAPSSGNQLFASLSPGLLVSGDTLNNDRYQGVQLEEGSASVSSSLISGGNVGIQLVQRAGQSTGMQVTATANTIKGESVAAAQVLSDQEPTDLPGSFTLTLNDFVSDAAGVLDNSKNLRVIQLLNF